MPAIAFATVVGLAVKALAVLDTLRGVLRILPVRVVDFHTHAFILFFTVAFI
jgi:hypothetical protein